MDTLIWPWGLKTSVTSKLSMKFKSTLLVMLIETYFHSECQSLSQTSQWIYFICTELTFIIMHWSSIWLKYYVNSEIPNSALHFIFAGIVYYFLKKALQRLSNMWRPIVKMRRLLFDYQLRDKVYIKSKTLKTQQNPSSSTWRALKIAILNL